MSNQLPADCLSEIFNYLDGNKAALHSCLLVNRLWCEVSVRVLWRNIWDLKRNVSPSCRFGISSQILNTLINCLSNESKDLLYKNGAIPTPTSKSPLFNYASFCKVLSILDINLILDDVFYDKKYFKSRKSITYTLLNNNNMIAQEILKMFMKQSTLKKLTYYSDFYDRNIPDFINFFGAEDCLKNLSELSCGSNVHSEFFYQLSKICHHIQSLNITFEETVSDGLKDLIFSQIGLKSLTLIQDHDDCSVIVPSLTNHSNTITKLVVHGVASYEPLSFIAGFINLQELIISFDYRDDFEEIQNIKFTKLQILKFVNGCPKAEFLIKFLENNGKILKELYIDKHNNLLNLAISKFCPNLKSLYTRFLKNEIRTLKIILISCQQLESIKIKSGKIYLKGNEVLETVAKFSPKNFHELKLRNYVRLESKDLESFFISWKNRKVQKSLSFIINNNNDENNGNIKIIEKYKKLGVLKKFEFE
ncbi:hypothetical protein RclHR1_08360006 [Rhizophagus clarus]|uniref:F-box domain-containing protein n=1 Tax=Rhizophagus clarus TaxID=94130 RepID=A0A2Z6SF01_9GLOM|nr:hypothetical protein RclHR1_08360006 [Rhizophagus clarus]GET01465.1 hypothetical protein GLOIN_2v1784405 [Rhizophagus clarus]